MIIINHLGSIHIYTQSHELYMALVLYDDCRPFFYNYDVLEIEVKLKVYPGNFKSYRQDIRVWIRISDCFASVMVLFCGFRQRIYAF